jgi:hypothetical protein
MGLPTSLLDMEEGLDKEIHFYAPLLFVLAIDPLHHIPRKATEQGNLHKLHGRAPTVHTSLYVDDGLQL